MTEAGLVPATRVTSRPSLNTPIVGIERMPNRDDNSGFRSVSTFNTSAFPARFSATFLISGATIRHVEMGVADPRGTAPCVESTQGTVPSSGSTQGTVPTLRQRHGIPDHAVVIGAFGGITPEKRIPELLDAVAAAPRRDLHVLLVGPRAAHYDVDLDVRRRGLEARFRDRFVAPRIPIDRIVRVLFEVRAGFVREAIHSVGR